MDVSVLWVTLLRIQCICVHKMDSLYVATSSTTIFPCHYVTVLPTLRTRVRTVWRVIGVVLLAQVLAFCWYLSLACFGHMYTCACGRACGGGGGCVTVLYISVTQTHPLRVQPQDVFVVTTSVISDGPSCQITSKIDLRWSAGGLIRACSGPLLRDGKVWTWTASVGRFLANVTCMISLFSGGLANVDTLSAPIVRSYYDCFVLWYSFKHFDRCYPVLLQLRRTVIFKTLHTQWQASCWGGRGGGVVVAPSAPLCSISYRVLSRIPQCLRASGNETSLCCKRFTASFGLRDCHRCQGEVYL